MPAAAVAGNLRQDNVFLRLSWQHGRWQPALDVLWTGEHIKLEAGLRAHGGPESAVVRQVPVQRQGYVVATWAF